MSARSSLLAALTAALVLSPAMAFAKDAKAPLQSEDVKTALVSVAPADAAAPIKPHYIAKAPADGVYDIVVLGDSLADGLHQGLTRLVKADARFKTYRKSKVNTGLVRSDRYDWNKGARKIAKQAKKGKYDIAVVMLGLNDLQSIREKGKKYHFPSDGWKVRYIERATRLASDLKEAGLSVYWTGIPITSPKRYQKHYAFMNEIFAEVTQAAGVKFVDTWTPLANAKGGYSAYHKNEAGKTVEIRARDGVHFTPGGYLVFAGIVNQIVQTDVEALAGGDS